MTRIVRIGGRCRSIGLLLFLLVLLAGGRPAVAASATDSVRPAPAASHAADLTRALSVIEDRTKDERVMERMREKLTVLGSRELRLVASLCDKIARDGHGAGADIAFSLVTALIVLS